MVEKIVANTAASVGKKAVKKGIGCLFFWGNIAAMAVVVVLLLVGVIFWLDIYTHNGEGIEVPDVCGQTQSEVQGKLNDMGLLLVINDSSYIEGKPAGVIISQSPDAGMKVKSGRVIYVTINSLTLPTVRIPDLIDNCSYREAQARLKSLGFNILAPHLISGEKDWLYGIRYKGRNVVTGESVPRGADLTLVIGSGTLGEDDMIYGTDGYDESSSESTGDASDDIDDFLEVIE